MLRVYVRDFWLFWHDGLADKFDIVATVDRQAYASTIEFYRDAVKTLSDCGASVSCVNLEDLTDPDPSPMRQTIGTSSIFVDARTWRIFQAADIFWNVAKTLREPFFIGVTEDLRYFIIAKPKGNVTGSDMPKPVTQHGKWLLADIESTVWSRYTEVTHVRIYCEPSSAYPNPFEEFHREAIAELLANGATVSHLGKSDRIWLFPHAHLLPDIFKEAVATLPEPYRVGIKDDLLWFYILKPKKGKR